MTPKLTHLLERIRTRLDEQEAQLMHRFAAQAAAAAALAKNPAMRKAMARTADYWDHQGDAASHLTQASKISKKARRKKSKKA